MAEQRFEYLTVKIAALRTNETKLGERIDSAAQDGWRLASTPSSQYGIEYLIFERPVSA